MEKQNTGSELPPRCSLWYQLSAGSIDQHSKPHWFCFQLVYSQLKQDTLESQTTMSMTLLADGWCGIFLAGWTRVLPLHRLVLVSGFLWWIHVLFYYKTRAWKFSEVFIINFQNPALGGDLTYSGFRGYILLIPWHAQVLVNYSINALMRNVTLSS